MKQIKERTQIAKALNFGKYPVLDLDIEKPIKVVGDKISGYYGCKVRVPWNYQGETVYEVCDLKYWKDQDKLELSCGGCCFKAGFGYSDVMEMLENANAPIVDKGQEFILVVHDRSTAEVFLMKMTDYKDIHCQTVLETDESLAEVIKVFEARQ